MGKSSNTDLRTISRRGLLGGLTSVIALQQAHALIAAENAIGYANDARPEAVPTKVCVRAIARDGKFLGDDVGGALITIRDAETRQVLAKGKTTGNSGTNGPGGVMCASLRRGEPIPTANASSFTATLNLDRPRRLEISAYGPLGIPRSANTATATQWVYPGKDVLEGDGFLLEIPGLIVQILSPVNHSSKRTSGEVTIQAHVAMMCGCPIDYKTEEARMVCPELRPDEQPWLPNEFEVAAVVCAPSGARITIPMQFVDGTPTPGQFAGVWQQPLPGSHEITVYAYQKATGNTGVDTATVFVGS